MECLCWDILWYPTPLCHDTPSTGTVAPSSIYPHSYSSLLPHWHTTHTTHTDYPCQSELCHVSSVRGPIPRTVLQNICSGSSGHMPSDAGEALHLHREAPCQATACKTNRQGTREKVQLRTNAEWSRDGGRVVTFVKGDLGLLCSDLKRCHNTLHKLFEVCR